MKQLRIFSNIRGNWFYTKLWGFLVDTVVFETCPSRDDWRKVSVEVRDFRHRHQLKTHFVSITLFLPLDGGGQVGVKWWYSLSFHPVR